MVGTSSPVFSAGRSREAAVVLGVLFFWDFGDEGPDELCSSLVVGFRSVGPTFPQMMGDGTWDMGHGKGVVWHGRNEMGMGGPF